LQVGDVDESRITSLIPAAGFLIDNYVDRCEPLPGPPADPVLQGVLEQVTVELYRRKDAPPSSSSDWSSGPGSFRFGAVDPIGEVITQLAPYKQRHGIA
jgi:hypothetical protein